MKKGLSFIELLIAIAILGILAAIVLPTFQSHSQQAKEAAAKDNLRIVRNAIEIYAAHHNGVPPGYINGDVSQPPNYTFFQLQLIKATTAQSELAEPRTPGYPFGPYLPKMPKNPFNGVWYPLVLDDTETFPQDATGTYGYVYKPATKTIKLDWPGRDKKGVRYYDY